MRIERYLLTNLKEEVTLYLEYPKNNRESDFYCEIGIIGDDIDKKTFIHGIDAIQALTLSIRHLDSFASRVSESIRPRYLYWELGTEEDRFGLKAIGI